jgi:hypothetical protein
MMSRPEPAIGMSGCSDRDVSRIGPIIAVAHRRVKEPPHTNTDA